MVMKIDTANASRPLIGSLVFWGVLLFLLIIFFHSGGYQR
jgi:hypothetical protein